MKVRSPEDLDELETLALIDMSYSRLDTYEMCPSKYFFTYIQKEDRVFGAAATLGNIIHDVLEDHVGEKLDSRILHESMLRHRQERDPDGQIGDNLIAAGKEMLDEFVDRHSDEKFDVIGKELSFEIVIGSALVRGFIDLVIRRPDGVISVVDYKSGRHEVTFQNAPDNLQIGIYALALRHMFPAEKSIHAELYYLRTGRRKGHMFSMQDMDNVYQRVLGQLDTIINDKNFSATSNIRPCVSFCDFATNGACRVGVMRRKGNSRW